MSSKTAYARTQDEVDQALKSADRIIVEGDQTLLAYAAAKVAISQEGSFEPVRPSMAPEAAAAHPRPPSAAMAGAPFPASAPAPQARKSSSRGLLVGLVLGLIAIVLVIAAVSRFSTRAPAPASASAPVPAGASASQAHPASSESSALDSIASALDKDRVAACLRQYRDRPREEAARLCATASPERPKPETASDLPQALPPTSAPTSTPPPTAPEAAPTSPAPAPEAAADRAGNLIGLAWPLVALAAIVLMYLLARQALSLGSDVRLEWRVTKQASGRLVISKQRARTGRKPPGKTPATA